MKSKFQINKYISWGFMFFREAWLEFLSQLKAKNINKISLGIGVFDGVHCGHVKLLNALAEYAHRHNSCPTALTFSPHPRTLTSPDHPPKLLLPLEKRIELLKKSGADEVFVIRFDQEFAHLIAEEFLDILCLQNEIEISSITVGRNWRFGHYGRGNADMLASFCAQNNIFFQPIEELKTGGEVISSSNIRLAITNGMFEKASGMLGRKFVLSGKVVKGFSFAGDKLGHPTANLIPDSEILPPDGVYGAKVTVDNSVYLAAVNIGVAPSFAFNQYQRRVEVHLLDFDGNLYDHTIEVDLLKYIRNERFFESADALKSQIMLDIQQIKSLK